jgi:hypothetical protein
VSALNGMAFPVAGESSSAARKQQVPNRRAVRNDTKLEDWTLTAESYFIAVTRLPRRDL